MSFSPQASLRWRARGKLAGTRFFSCPFAPFSEGAQLPSQPRVKALRFFGHLFLEQELRVLPLRFASHIAVQPKRFTQSTIPMACFARRFPSRKTTRFLSGFFRSLQSGAFVFGLYQTCSHFSLFFAAWDFFFYGSLLEPLQVSQTQTRCRRLLRLPLLLIRKKAQWGIQSPCGKKLKWKNFLNRGLRLK